MTDKTGVETFESGMSFCWDCVAYTCTHAELADSEETTENGGQTDR